MSTHTEVQKLYLKTRLINTKARHTVCVYNLIDDKFYTDCGGCDDQEPGTTRSILQFMRLNNIENRVFFIARYCGKEKLGSKRFECYLHAAKLALKNNPRNTIMEVDQIVDEELTTPKERQTQSMKLTWKDRWQSSVRGPQARVSREFPRKCSKLAQVGPKSCPFQ